VGQVYTALQFRRLQQARRHAGTLAGALLSLYCIPNTKHKNGQVWGSP